MTDRTLVVVSDEHRVGVGRTDLAAVAARRWSNEVPDA